MSISKYVAMRLPYLEYQYGLIPSGYCYSCFKSFIGRCICLSTYTFPLVIDLQLCIRYVSGNKITSESSPETNWFDKCESLCCAVFDHSGVVISVRCAYKLTCQSPNICNFQHKSLKNSFSLSACKQTYVPGTRYQT